MKEIRFLLPGTWKCGGLFVAIRFVELMSKIIPTHIFTYVDKEEEYPFIDLKRIPEDENIVWFITWGPHVNRLVDRFANKKVIYYAQSTCWEAPRVNGTPILCISRFVMAHWAKHAPYSPLYLVEPVLDPNCRKLGLNRDIDVLYLSRKSTSYLDKILVPTLESKCKVHIQTEFIPHDELFRLYNRSKVYLYSSQQPPTGMGDGFGLQPLEAMVCGCSVFSNLHGGLSDYVDPGICGHKLETYSVEYDINRILSAVRNHTGQNPREEYLRKRYSVDNFYDKMRSIWPEIEEFFQMKDQISQSLLSELKFHKHETYYWIKKWFSSRHF
jgi:hypothetical protein